MKKNKNDGDVSLFNKAAETPPRKHGKKTAAFLRRNAVEVMYFRIFKKIILISVTTISSFLLVVYGFTLVYDRTGSFTVNVKSQDITYNITLSEDDTFTDRTSVLTSKNIAKLDNISGKDIDANVDEINGEHSTAKYLAYTFYCKNLCGTDCCLSYELTFNNVTNGMDEAIRVRLYVNGEYLDYAKTKSGKDGTLGMEEDFCDRTFANINTVCYGDVNNVPADGIVKFTIVAWLEGDDYDCKDPIKGGSVKFAMQITAGEVK